MAGLFLVIVAATGARVVWVNNDTDEDGLSDCRERAGLRSATSGTVWKTQPGRSDSDGDRVPDGEEVVTDGSDGILAQLGQLWSCHGVRYKAWSDPSLKDTDEDGLNDARELSDGSDPYAEDSDDDELGDKDEWAWGADANLKDTDDDEIPDGEDISRGFVPVAIDERIATQKWQSEFIDGVTKGEFEDIDSVPQLLGAISGGASSTIPIIGWITGTAADIRDVVADVSDGDWVSAGASGAGLLPYAGDAIRASEQFGKFVVRHHDKVKLAIRALSAQEKIPDSVRIKLLGVAHPTKVRKLQKSGLSDGQILEFAKRGTALPSLVSLLGRSGVKVVTGIAARYADDAGFTESPADAEKALREYAAKVGGRADVADGPVYLGGFPPGDFIGGRLIDACTACEPGPQGGTSTLRIAKAGSHLYSETVHDQIEKDTYLREQGYRVEWHFFAGRTGLSVDPRLLRALDRAEIPVYVHLPG